MATYGLAKLTMQELIAHWRAYAKRSRSTPRIVNLGIKEIRSDPEYWTDKGWPSLLARIDAGIIDNPRTRKSKRRAKNSGPRVYVRGGKARRVVVKGNEFAIARIMADAGIPFIFVRRAGVNTVGDVPTQHIAKLTRLLAARPELEGRYAALEKPRVNPVKITKGGRPTPFRVWTRSRERPQWSPTVKTHSLAKAISVAVRMGKRGYGIRITGPREILRLIK